MAIINKIRDRSALVLVVVGLGMALFLFSDMVGFNTSLFGDTNRYVGEINGKQITYEEFEKEVDQMMYTYQLNTMDQEGNVQPVPPEQMDGLRDQAWNNLLYKYAYRPQFEAAGMAMTDDELVELVQGENIHPTIRDAFKNPETGQFDRNMLRTYLSRVSQDQIQMAVWSNFERNLPQDRLTNKYINAISKTNYVTSAEAKRTYLEQTATLTADYLYIPYTAIPDSTISLSEEELKAHLEEHYQEFALDRKSASLSYVAFSIAPAREDSMVVRENLKELKAIFKDAKDDSAFVANNSDLENPIEFKTVDNLDPALVNNTSSLEVGEVYGPFLNRQGQYTLYKVVDTKEEGQEFARASHILFQFAEDKPSEEAEAKALAQKVLDSIQSGQKSFETMAAIHGTDATASRGGDLGWFSRGRMVAEFEEAIFNAKETGVQNKITKTQFGYHLIKVTSVPANTQYKVASISREVFSGASTREVVYQQASEFQAVSEGLEAFKKNAEERGLSVQEADAIAPDQKSINQLQNVSELTRWAFGEGEVGSVSPVYETDDFFVVAYLKSRADAGEVSLEDVRDQVESQVRNKKKFEQIKAKLSGANLQEMKTAFGKGATIQSGQEVKLSASSLPGVGFDPATVGKIFSSKANEIGSPIMGKTALVVSQVKERKLPGPIADYTTYVNQAKQAALSRAAYNVSEAIKEYVGVEDMRYKFY